MSLQATLLLACCVNVIILTAQSGAISNGKENRQFGVHVRSTEDAEDDDDYNPLSEVVNELKAKVAELTRRNMMFAGIKIRREEAEEEDANKYYVAKKSVVEGGGSDEKPKSMMRSVVERLFRKEAPAALKQNIAKKSHKVELEDRDYNTILGG